MRPSDRGAGFWLARILVAFPLLMAGGLAICCPCDHVLSCHKSLFSELILFSVSIFVVANFLAPTVFDF